MQALGLIGLSVGEEVGGGTGVAVDGGGGTGVAVGGGVGDPTGAVGGGGDPGSGVGEGGCEVGLPPPPLDDVEVGPNVGLKVGVGVGVGAKLAVGIGTSVSVSNCSASIVAATAVSTTPGSAEPPNANRLAVDSASIVAIKYSEGVGVPALASTGLTSPGNPPFSAQAVSGSATIASAASP